MKKINFLLAFILIGMLKLNAQVVLPASWNCDGPTPPSTDWALNLGANPNYASSSACEGAGSLRFDLTNESLTIFFATQPGTITYDIRGMVGSAPQWNGTFILQESADGNTWSTFKTHTGVGNIPKDNCSPQTATPQNSSTRYVRFFFQNKISGNDAGGGGNVNVDNIAIALPVQTTPKLKVTQESTQLNLPSGATTFPFNQGQNPAVFTLSNIGTQDDLVITDIQISGPHASDFAQGGVSVPATVSASGSTPLNITFTPSGDGTRQAILTIFSNDDTDPEYVVNLYAVNGNFSTEPNFTPSSITFPTNKSYRVIGNFQTNNNNLDFWGGYLVLYKSGSAVTDEPVDGTEYRVGQGIGSSKVAYVGKLNSSSINFNTNGVIAGTTYHYKLFTYNGTGTYTNYNNTSTSSANITTPATMVSASEYTSVNTANASFVTDLKSVINPHTAIFYSNYAPTMINQFASRDTFVTIGANSFSKYIQCVYSGIRSFYNTFDFTALGLSREHTFPHSWMPSFPADNPEKPEYNDQHNLYPTRQTNVNDLRCNYPLGEVVTVEQTFSNVKLGLNANGNRVFEPIDAHKGRAARSLMYMATCYNGTTGEFNFNRPIGKQCLQTQINYPQDQNLVKKWHFMYPPDNYDIARNDYLDSLQTNRNPFVDNADYACYIDFTNMSHIATPNNPCYVLNVDENELKSFSLYPNPTVNDFTLSFQLEKAEILNVEVLDLTGKVVLKHQFNATVGINTQTLSLGTLSSGIYAVRVFNNAINSVRLVEKF